MHTCTCDTSSMPPPPHFVYRTTTDKVATLLDGISAGGGGVVHIQHMGGRDWTVITTGGSYRHTAEARDDADEVAARRAGAQR